MAKTFTFDEFVSKPKTFTFEEFSGGQAATAVAPVQASLEAPAAPRTAPIAPGVAQTPPAGSRLVGDPGAVDFMAWQGDTTQSMALPPAQTVLTMPGAEVDTTSRGPKPVSRPVAPRSSLPGWMMEPGQVTIRSKPKTDEERQTIITGLRQSGLDVETEKEHREREAEFIRQRESRNAASPSVLKEVSTPPDRETSVIPDAVIDVPGAAKVAAADPAWRAAVGQLDDNAIRGAAYIKPEHPIVAKLWEELRPELEAIATENASIQKHMGYGPDFGTAVKYNVAVGKALVGGEVGRASRFLTNWLKKRERDKDVAALFQSENLADRVAAARLSRAVDTAFAGSVPASINMGAGALSALTMGLVRPEVPVATETQTAAGEAGQAAGLLAWLALPEVVSQLRGLGARRAAWKAMAEAKTPEGVGEAFVRAAQTKYPGVRPEDAGKLYATELTEKGLIPKPIHDLLSRPRLAAETPVQQKTAARLSDIQLAPVAAPQMTSPPSGVARQTGLAPGAFTGGVVGEGATPAPVPTVAANPAQNAPGQQIVPEAAPTPTPAETVPPAHTKAPTEGAKQLSVTELVNEIKAANDQFNQAYNEPGYKAIDEARARLHKARKELSDAAGPKELEPWQITKRQFEARNVIERSVTGEFNRILEGLRQQASEEAGYEVPAHEPYIPDREATTHRRAVAEAVEQGKPVPPAVLEEYRGQPWADAALAKLAPAPGIAPVEGAKQPWEMKPIEYEDLHWRDFYQAGANSTQPRAQTEKAARRMAFEQFGREIRKAVESGQTVPRNNIVWFKGQSWADAALAPAQAEPAPQGAAAPSSQKQPWEMTKEEQWSNGPPRGEKPPLGTLWNMSVLEIWHESQVEEAVAEGKPVPRAVLADYRGEPWADAALVKLTPTQETANAVQEIKTKSAQTVEQAKGRREGQAEKVDASPTTVKLAAKLGVDLSKVQGTGKAGRITLKDVKTARPQPTFAGKALAQGGKPRYADSGEWHEALDIVSALGDKGTLEIYDQAQSGSLYGNIRFHDGRVMPIRIADHPSPRPGATAIVAKAIKEAVIPASDAARAEDVLGQSPSTKAAQTKTIPTKRAEQLPERASRIALLVDERSRILKEALAERADSIGGDYERTGRASEIQGELDNIDRDLKYLGYGGPMPSLAEAITKDWWEPRGQQMAMAGKTAPAGEVSLAPEILAEKAKALRNVAQAKAIPVSEGGPGPAPAEQAMAGKAEVPLAPAKPGIVEDFAKEDTGSLNVKGMEEVFGAAGKAIADTKVGAGLRQAWRSMVTLPARAVENIPDGNPIATARDWLGGLLFADYKRPGTWVAKLARFRGESNDVRNVANDIAKAYHRAFVEAKLDPEAPETHILIESVLRGEVDINRLPKPLQVWAQQMRDSLDAESLNAATNFRAAGMDTLANIYEGNVGKYLKNIPASTVLPTAKAKAFLGKLLGPRLSRSWGKMKRDKWAVKVDGKITKYDTEEEAQLAYKAAIEQKKTDLITARGQKKEWTLTRSGKVPKRGGGFIDWSKTEEGIGMDTADLYRRAAKRVTLIDPIPKEWRLKNELHNPAYLGVQSIIETRHNAELVKLFGYAAKKWGQAAPAGSVQSIDEWATENNLAKLPETGRLHDLKGMYVPKEIADDLTELVALPSTAAKIYRAYLTAWKSSKTIYNPATHGRNVIGNLFFAYVGRTSLWNPEHWGHYVDAVHSLATKDVDVRDLTKRNVIGTEYFGADLKRIDNSVRRAASLGRADQITSIIAGVHNTVGNIYALEDQVFKVAAYKIYRGRGMSKNRAAAEVNRWFPNYANTAKLTRIMRQSPLGAPFMSFLDQSLRIGGRAFKDRPLRLAAIVALPAILSYIAVHMLGMSPDEKDVVDASRSYWEPILPMRDDKGRVMTLDLRYIMPLANDLMIQQREGVVTLPWAFQGPLAKGVVEQMFNTDMFTGRQIAPTNEDATTGEKATARLKQAAKTILPIPSPLVYAPGRLAEAARDGTQETLARAILGTTAGINIRKPYIREEDAKGLVHRALAEGDEPLAIALLSIYNDKYKNPNAKPLNMRTFRAKQQPDYYWRLYLNRAADNLRRGNDEWARETIQQYEDRHPDMKPLTMDEVKHRAGR